jgi:hypothetical protein
MSTSPYMQGQVCAPAGRKGLSFLDRFPWCCHFSASKRAQIVRHSF